MYEELFSYAGPKFFYPVCPVSRVLQRAVDALARSRCIGKARSRCIGKLHGIQPPTP